LRNLSIALAYATAELPEKYLKILLRVGETSLKALKVFYDCSGGNSRPSRLSGVGGGNFLGAERSPLSSCSRSALARLRLNTNAQPRTSNVEISKPASRCMANRVDACGAHHRNDDLDHLLAVGELAGAHSAAKHG
jgi:hypothetical protein